MSCLQSQCSGHYEETTAKLNFYKNLYSKGNVRRIFAQEHRGLLEREAREELERRFISSQHRSNPNLLSATSTLEMDLVRQFCGAFFSRMSFGRSLQEAVAGVPPVARQSGLEGFPHRAIAEGEAIE